MTACSRTVGAISPAQQQATATSIPTVPAAGHPTYTVQRGDVQNVLAFTGRWLPRDQTQLSFQIAGTVRRVNVQRGDTVTAGQLLADYQIGALEDQLAAAELQLKTAKSSVASGNLGSVSSVTDAEVALANAKLALEKTILGNPWPAVESARIDVNNSKNLVDSAQRAYDDAISRPANPGSVIDAAYDQLTSAQSKLKSAQAAYDAAAQQYIQYQVTIKEAKNMVIAAQLTLERVKHGGGSAQNLQAVDAAQLTVDQILASIKQSSLYAPSSGEVLEVNIKPGDMVKAFDLVIVIGRPTPKEAVANLAIGDAQQLSIGLVGVCQAINQPETAVQCAVRRIPLDARESDQTTRIAASLDGLLTGQLVEVKMPLQVHQNVLWLPPAAIRTFQNRTYVVIQTPDGQRVTDIVLGLQTPERVEIQSGVSEGDVVVGP
ncbi:MAG: efflux RND transporter periplasmic adaptor subunit [Aggregatilineales bacterium]